MTAPGLVVPGPGVYADLPESVYLRDPVPGGSLSCSGAKLLLPPSCPARYQWQKQHGQVPKPQFDFGHAVHSLVLGVGEPIVVIDADDWRSKAAREQRDEAHAAGHVPLLRADHEAASNAAHAVMAHPLAGLLFHKGQPETSLFWRDEEHDVMRRARLDWLGALPSGRPVIVDLKTCQSAAPSAIAKSVATYRYYMQHPAYVDGAEALELAEQPAFLFVFVESAAPHLVTVVELDDEAVAEGRALNRRALATYRECVETDTWPGYSSDVELVSLPRWAVAA